MTLTELNETIQKLRAERRDVADKLSALLADETISVGEARKQEKTLRDLMRNYHALLTPLENERAEIDRVVKGGKRKRKEPWLAEPVTLG